MAIARVGRLPLWQPLGTRDFRLLFTGETVSLLGSQFSSVAVAWLGYKVTGSGLALGSVFIVGGLPRLILLLVGGAVTDRFSPWRVFALTNILFALTSGILAALAFANQIQLWYLYVDSFLLGAGSAFVFPALFSIIPRTLATEHLNAGNALMESMNALTAFIGPSLAGIMIAFSGRTSGTGIAFTLDAASFLFSLLMLLRMSSGARAIRVEAHGEKQRGGIAGLLLSVKDGLIVAWQDIGLRTFLLLLLVNNLAFYGPYRIGLAALAVHRFPQGAGALGTLYGAWGAGALVGTLAAGFLQGLRRYGLLMVAGAGVQGSCFVLLGFAPNVAIAVALVAAVGLEGGVGNVVFGSWLQMRTAPDMLGRAMSLVGLANIGVTPLSYALSGVLVDVEPTLMFVLAGGVVLLVAGGAAMSRTVRGMS